MLELLLVVGGLGQLHDLFWSANHVLVFVVHLSRDLLIVLPGDVLELLVSQERELVQKLGHKALQNEHLIGVKLFFSSNLRRGREPLGLWAPVSNNTNDVLQGEKLLDGLLLHFS